MLREGFDAQEYQVGLYRDEKGLMDLYGRAKRAAAESPPERAQAPRTQLDAEHAHEALRARGEALRLEEEARVTEEAARVNLANLSPADEALLGMDEADMDVEERRRLSVLLVAAVRCVVPSSAEELNPALAGFEYGECRLSGTDRARMREQAAARRAELVAMMPPLRASLGGALGGLRLEPPAQRAPVALSAPTQLKTPDPYRTEGCLPSAGRYYTDERKNSSGKRAAMPFYMSKKFPLVHSLAHRFGHHPAFLHPDSPLCMPTEVLAENAQSLAKLDPRTLEFVEGTRVALVNATLALDDPSNALGFQNHLERLVWAAQRQYTDFVLVLRHGQANVSVSGRGYGQQLDKDVALHAGIPAETTLVLCSNSMEDQARAFAQAVHARMAARSARLVGRLENAMREGLREELEAADAPTSYTVFACEKDEDIYQGWVRVALKERFPGLYGTYSRQTSAESGWTAIPLEATPPPAYKFRNPHATGRLLEYLGLLGDVGADYFLYVRPRGVKTPCVRDNLGRLGVRTGMSRVDRDAWARAVRRLKTACGEPRKSAAGSQAFVLTNDGPLQQTLSRWKPGEKKASKRVDHLLFFGPEGSGTQMLYERRAGAKGAESNTEYLNCAGRLFARVPPLNLLRTELLAFAILWSPAGRDYLLPNRMDARRILLDDTPRTSGAARTGPRASSSRAPRYSPPRSLSELREREYEAELPPRPPSSPAETE